MSTLVQEGQFSEQVIASAPATNRSRSSQPLEKLIAIVVAASVLSRGRNENGLFDDLHLKSGGRVHADNLRAAVSRRHQSVRRIGRND